VVSNGKYGVVTGFFLFLGLATLGFFIYSAAIQYREYERTVVAKGLSEREVKSDIVLWPIRFTVTDNDLEKVYRLIDINSLKIQQFLLAKGIGDKEISFAIPSITDKVAQQYGGGRQAPFRYTASGTVTVYSKKVDQVRHIMSSLSELGRQGIVFSDAEYASRPEYIFTGLNGIKPAMIEEATRKAREVAEKFAADSNSRLGKIRKARQGQFTITPRDKNNPHIKKIRVVSTVEYYLSD
jgi:hypothetical protein